MYSCTICIPHVDTPNFLYGCIDQIKRNQHPEIIYEIIIVDQSIDPTHNKIREKYKNDPKIKVIKAQKIDCGYAIDTGIKYATFDYFCTLDCDAIPIHKNWLYLPIKMIEKYNFIFVGADFNMDDAYKIKGVKEKFTIISNFYRVCKTKTMKMLSEKVGFVNPYNRPKVNKPSLKSLNILWSGPDWADSSVIANWYIDTQKLGSKLSLSVDKYLGHCPKQGMYGYVVESMVAHLGFSTNFNKILDVEKENNFGPKYIALRKLIDIYGFTQSVLDFINSSFVSEIRTFREIDGDEIKSENEIYKYIEEIKKS